jgi:hypothetical protein
VVIVAALLGYCICFEAGTPISSASALIVLICVKVARTRPLSHLNGFEQIEMWPLEYLSADFKAVVGVQVSEAIIQKRLADSIRDIAPISNQNKHVSIL